MAKIHYVSTARKRRSVAQEQKHLYYKPVVERQNLILWHGDAKDFLTELLHRGFKAHLVLTSPPYNVGIDYGVYKDDMRWEDYLSWLTEIFSLCHSLLCEGGRLVLNVPHVVKFGLGKRYFPFADYQGVLQDAGFDLVDVIVWIKAKNEKEVVGFAGRSFAFGSRRSPKNPIMRPVSEFLLIGKKQGEFREDAPPDISDEEFRSWTCSAWLISTVSHPVHPATFPPELARRVIKLYSTPGQWILDPFMGVGTCGKVDLSLGRSFAGSELEYKYFTEVLKLL